MDGKARRDFIVTTLKNTGAPVTGSALSACCQVSRQIIVGDVALLRAQGVQIISTPRGYQLVAEKKTAYTRTFVCRHGPKEMEAELNAIVDNGGMVQNVVIEHEVYGTLTGTLHLHSRRDVSQYIKKMKDSQAPLLSSISGGIHTHLVEADSEEDLNAIEKALQDLGVLYQG